MLSPADELWRLQTEIAQFKAALDGVGAGGPWPAQELPRGGAPAPGNSLSVV